MREREVRLYLAPMAGVTDSSFRRICRRHGADAVCTEMISARAMYYENEETWELLKHQKEEEPLTVQLFGSEPELMAKEAARLEGRCAAVDLNFGCPAPKIVKNHEGSFLLTQPDRLYEIVRAVSQAVSMPVTVKIRKGFYAGEDTAVRSAVAAERGGASMIAVHGRTAAQMYSGTADWGSIARVKAAVGVPVIGNGDIESAETALSMLDSTGCDHLMIGRASRGNPWLFGQIRAALCGKPAPFFPSAEDRIREAIEHGRMLVEDKGEYTGMQQMRSHGIWYIKGMRDAAGMRSRLQSVRTFSEFETLLLRYLDHVRAGGDGPACGGSMTGGI